MKYAWIAGNRDSFPIARMCRTLGVSPSGYYAWRKREPSPQSRRRDQIAQAAVEAYQESYGVYGYRKVHDDLIEQEIECCRETVRKILHEKGLFSRTKRKFVVTTDSRHTMPVAENLLDRQFEATGPNQKWAADITYLATDEGWLYLAVVIDLFSRLVVGWAMSERMTAQLACDALQMALWRRHRPTGVSVHSDRGSQYCSGAYQQLISEHDLQCSMSAKGNCYDNACAESFFHSLKVEAIHGEKFATREAMRQTVFEYIEVDYNRTRRHSANGFISPAAFEAQQVA